MISLHVGYFDNNIYECSNLDDDAWITITQTILLISHSPDIWIF